MRSIERNHPAGIAKLDPKFLLVAGFLWRTARAAFRLARLAVCLLLKKPLPKEAETDSVKAQQLKSSAFEKDQAFLNYGGIRWFSKYTPEALKARNVKAFPQGTALSFELAGNKKREVAIFGELYDEQIENIQSVLDGLIVDLECTDLPFSEIHLLKSAGKYLNESGIPDREIIGFSPDREGAVLLHEDAALDAELACSFFQRILSEERIRLSAVKKAQEALWNQPKTIQERLSRRPDYHPCDNRRRYGTLRGKPIIDMDAPVSGGVYLGAPAHEAIYVPDDSELLKQLYKEMLSEIRKIKLALGIGFEEKVMEIALRMTRLSFPHSSPEALLRLRQEHRLAADEEIALDFFVRNETGDSEHAALLLGYLLEKLSREQPNFLSGKLSVDRNWLPGGGRSWVRYSHGPKDIYLLDPLRNYFGRLDDYSCERWPYERKADFNSERIARPL